MKRALLAAAGGIVLALACAGGAARANDPQLRVLFIGNSLTAVNDLPHVVSTLSGGRIAYQPDAPGGGSPASPSTGPTASTRRSSARRSQHSSSRRGSPVRPPVASRCRTRRRSRGSSGRPQPRRSGARELTTERELAAAVGDDAIAP